MVEAHPLRYAVRLLGCDFNGGQLLLPHVELPPEDAAPEADAAPEDGEPPAEPLEMPESPTQVGPGHGRRMARWSLHEELMVGMIRLNADAAGLSYCILLLG